MGVSVIDGSRDDAAHRIDEACRADGFFVITGHGVDDGLFDRLDTAARDFFARPPGRKAQIEMALAGAAWRGWFPPGGELTSGVPDGKEGVYFGREDGPDHPRAGTPLHGANLFPDDSDLGPAVVEVLDELTDLGHRLCALIAVGLDLDADWFRSTITADPTILFRIFHYPALGAVDGAEWGVREHTDYGLLTIPAPGRRRRTRGPKSWWMDSGPADPGQLRVQHR